MLLFFGGKALSADVVTQLPDMSRGDYLTVKIAVIGPGDELYLWWGHIGLIIEDTLSGESRLYDWGVFSFEETNFYSNFAFGRLLYACAVTSVDSNFNRNIRTNRSITVYTLDLPPEKKLEILRFAENNARPENRNYWYHHFRDNCATRIRDIVDLGTSGNFYLRYAQAPGRLTLRGHVRRHTWFSPLWDWLLSFWMGQDIDTPITVWDEMFLPSEIGKRIEDFTYMAQGTERHLVSSVEVINEAEGRPPVLDAPRKSWPGAFLLSIAAAALFGFPALFAKKRNAARIAFGLGQSALGLFLGVIGLLLFFMTFFTNHDYTFHNSNVLFINPLLFAALPFGLVYAFTGNEKKRRRAAGILWILWTYVFVGAALSAALKILPGFYQQNQVTLALVLPAALALSLMSRRLAR
ncbi:MAG: DUF4105 domain-containing protein [Treponema sp.]|nr:DUF4105 domain-containing protein [Treponema sp.]